MRCLGRLKAIKRAEGDEPLTTDRVYAHLIKEKQREEAAEASDQHYTNLIKSKQMEDAEL